MILSFLFSFLLSLSFKRYFFQKRKHWRWNVKYENCSEFLSVLIAKKETVSLWHDAAAAKSLQSCLTLCDPVDGSPPGSPVPRLLQARTLEWVAISFSNAWQWKVKGKLLSHVWFLATPWTVAYQAPPSMGFSRQEYWSGLPFLSPMHESEKWKWSRSVMSDS